jgi:glutaredoxin
MKKKIISAIIILLALLAVSTFVFFRIQAVKNATKQITNNSDKIILFYGDGCPHCVNVEKFIADNKVEEKITFPKKEVFNNKENSLLLADKAKKCGLDTKNIGVPFLWDETTSKCFIGDGDIITFLQEKISR